MSKPKDLPCLIPYLAVRDPGQTLILYEAAFGFTLLGGEKRDQTGRIEHAEMDHQNMVIMFGLERVYNHRVLSPRPSNTLSPICLYLYCDDVDSFCAKAQSAGSPVIRPAEDTFWRDRMCQLSDIDGYYWFFASPL